MVKEVGAVAGDKDLYFNVLSYTSNEQDKGWNRGDGRFAFYYFNDSNSTNGWVSLSLATGEHGIYTGKLPSGEWDAVILCLMNGAAPANNWDNKWYQTVNLTPTASQNYFALSYGGKNGGGATGTWGTYTPARDFYFFNKGCIMNTTSPKINAYNAGSGDQQAVTKELTLVEGTNRIYHTALSSYVSDAKLNNGYSGLNNETEEFEIDTKDVVVFNDDWSHEWCSLAAAEYVDEYMHFDTVRESNEDNTHACEGESGYFVAARDNLPSDSTLKAEIMAISGVSERYNAWAAAYNATKTAGTILLSNETSDTSNSSIIIALVSFVAVLGTVGFVAIKRRKENA